MKNSLYICLFAVVALIFFSPILLQSKVCAPIDIVTNLYEPWADGNADTEVQNHYFVDFPEQYFLYLQHAYQSYRQEGRLGWNYLKNCGTPAYANTMAVPYSWRHQLLRVLPFWPAWHLSLIAQYLLAMVGMFLFLRGLDYRESLAVVGALAFAFCAHFSVWLYHLWAGGLVWLPWICWGLYKLRGGSRWGVTTPLFLALGFMGVHLQYAAFLVIAVFCIWLGWALEDRMAARKFNSKRLAIFLFLGALAVSLAGIMFVPCVHAYINTLKFGLVRGVSAYPQGLLSPVLNLIAYPVFIFPQLFGTPQTFDISKLFGLDLMHIPYYGSLLVALAFLGVFLRKLNITAKVLVCAGLILPLTPLVGPLYHRMLIIFTFGGIWLAVDLLQNLDEIRWQRIRVWLVWLFFLGTAVLLAVSIGLHIFQEEIFSRLWDTILPSVDAHMFGARTDWFAARLQRFLVEMKIWHPRTWVPWVLFGTSIYLMKFRRHAIFGWLLAAMILGQLWLYDYQWVVFNQPLHNEGSIYPVTKEIDAVEAEVVQTDRVLIAQKSGRLPLFPLNTLTYFDIPCARGYDSIVPNGIQKGIPPYPIIPESLPSAEFLGQKGVSHLIAFAEDEAPGEGWMLARKAGKIAIYSNRFAGSWYRVETKDGIVPIEPLRHEHNTRQLRLPAGTAKVMLRENWDEGWQYRIEGKKWLNMQRAEDRSMFADFDPVSKSAIFEMRYRPRAKRIGMLVSLVALCCYLLFALRWRGAKAVDG